MRDELELQTYLSLARAERWLLLAQKLLSAVAVRTISEAKGNSVTTKFMTTQQLRVRLSKRLFFQLAHCTSMESAEISLLRRIGVLRERRQSVELWAADAVLSSPAMKSLLAEARHFLEIYKEGMFMLEIMGNGSVLNIKYDPSIKTAVLKFKVKLMCDAVVADLRLEHMGREMRGDTLGACGLWPGCYVEVSGTNADPNAGS